MNLDPTLLQQQKATLIELAMTMPDTPIILHAAQREHLEGVLSLLDAVQDTFVVPIKQTHSHHVPHQHLRRL